MGERRGTKALEMWCRRMTEGYPGVKIDNMTTSWRDGLAFCAMIHHFRPDLIEFDKLNKEDVYYNNELAFTTAEKYLGIPALLDADDMAAYEVPDRLSILTYLSQFYQTFAAQDSANRLKRPSPATEKAQLNKAPGGPPAKMAHVAGVLRRDPCHKCQLPVFLAERLAIGKKIFHRTCLKCARCGSQLTPGSFYETEVDNEFCCETCPDEELKMQMESPSAAASTSANDATELRSDSFSRSAKGIRSSIADRLAFFEQAKHGTDAGSSSSSPIVQPHADVDSKLLQRNISDEEKSKSLHRKSDAGTPYKMNAAFNSFLQDTIDGGDGQAESESSSSCETEDDVSASVAASTTASASASEPTQADGADTDGDMSIELEAPALPQSESPAVIAQSDGDQVVTSKPTTPASSKRFSSSVQLQLSRPKTPPPTVRSSGGEEQNSPCSVAIESTPSTLTLTHDFVNNNGNATELEENSVPLTAKARSDVESNDNRCVSKEMPIAHGDNNQLERELRELESESSTDAESDRATGEVELRKPHSSEISVPNAEDVATTERLSVVRARLQQFEVLSGNQNEAKSSENSRTASPGHVRIGEAIEQATADKSPEEVPELPLKEEYNDVLTEAVPPTTVAGETKEQTESLDEVPLIVKDNELVADKSNEVPAEDARQSKEEEAEVVIEPPSQAVAVPSMPQPSPRRLAAAKNDSESYPADLNPFKSDESDADEEQKRESDKENLPKEPLSNISQPAPVQSLNPFDSSDDEIELEKPRNSISSTTLTPRVPPPRPPPPRISRNPFGDETDEDSSNFSRQSSLTSSLTKKTPVPTPRTNLSQNPTPEPTPRLSTKQQQQQQQHQHQHQQHHTPGQSAGGDFYGSSNSLTTPPSWHRNSDVRGSNNSLTSSGGGTIRSRKNRKAPPPPPLQPPVKELFPSSENVGIDGSISSTPSSSTRGSPRSGRKKRPAPAPPKPARLEAGAVNGTGSKNLLSYPLQNESKSKLSDEEKVLLEGKQFSAASLDHRTHAGHDRESLKSQRRLIPLDVSLLDEAIVAGSQSDDLKSHQQETSLSLYSEDEQVVYRRTIMPSAVDMTPTHEHTSMLESLSGAASQLEKLKDNKEAKNRNRQSQLSTSSGADDGDLLLNKSMHGKWKRRKGPAPALPIPPRKVLQMLPLQEIRHELDIIEVQQQGLEKQGVILEKMIRDRCEGENGELLGKSVADGGGGVTTDSTKNSKEVEDLILQLFELVNEKNELFRRQAELMYLRRMHRLEQEQADLEYEIRVLMAQPERNKTDSDKAREEALIARLVEVVQLRNEVVDCLEMDRLREAEEDMSIKQRLELHTAHRDETDGSSPKSSSKLSKKEKKKQKELKKFGKSKKIDADKDADESELTVDKVKTKKKKRKFLF